MFCLESADQSIEWRKFRCTCTNTYERLQRMKFIDPSSTATSFGQAGQDHQPTHNPNEMTPENMERWSEAILRQLLKWSQLVIIPLSGWWFHTCS